MAKPQKNETVRCTYFLWKIFRRGGLWYADGRSNSVDAGRHSLGTVDRDEALKLLAELDLVRAVALGLAKQSGLPAAQERPLPLEEGRKLYEAHINRPRVTGGVRKSTAKRYRAVLDKFLPYAAKNGVTVWNGVTATLTAYARSLEDKDYANKTLHNELITLKTMIRWLIGEGHLRGVEPIKLKLRKSESERAYCWRSQEVQAMVEFCRTREAIHWLGNVVIALACTGLRIAELVALRWSDLDLTKGRLALTDESGRSAKKDRPRRELKSGRSRSFPIHPDLAQVLKSLTPQGPFVFYGPRGGRLKPDTVRRILVREVLVPMAEEFPASVDAKGFQDGRLHSFRHYFCSSCANNGVPERMVMAWLGHRDSEMVHHYYHLNDDEARAKMDQVNFLGTSTDVPSRNPGESLEGRKEEALDPQDPENKGAD